MLRCARFNFYDLSQDYGPSDRDIRHKFNFYAYGELPWGFQGNTRIQARSAQPITTSPRVLASVDRGRNWDRKDNAYFSFDWRLQRPIKFGKGGTDSENVGLEQVGVRGRKHARLGSQNFPRLFSAPFISLLKHIKI